MKENASCCAECLAALEALRNLAAETGALIAVCGEELRLITGNTNLAVLKLRLAEALAQVAKAELRKP